MAVPRAGFKNTSHHFGGSLEQSSRDKKGKNPRCSTATTAVFALLISRTLLKFPPKLTQLIFETSSRFVDCGKRILFISVIILICTSSLVLAETIDNIVVRKAQRVLELKRGDVVIETFKVALGRNPIGPKEQQGDGKTPEGEYTISGRNARSAFHRSLRISYPNARDRKNAARRGVDPGGDIMIHGLSPSYRGPQALHTSVDWTEGCIAVTDAEIDKMWRIVKDGTKVLIVQ